MPYDPSIRQLPDVSSYEYLAEHGPVLPKKKRKKASGKLRQHFQTTNQSPSRSQAQYLLQGPAKLPQLQQVARESAPYLNKAGILNGYIQRRGGNLSKEERTKTLKKLAMARLQHNESPGRTPSKGGHFISVSKKTCSPERQQSIQKILDGGAYDSLESDATLHQRRRNQSLQIQSEAEILAAGVMAGPIIIQQEPKHGGPRRNDARGLGFSSQ